MNNILLDKSKYLKSKRFLLGFEVEMILDKDKLSYDDFNHKIQSLHRDIDVGCDDSIETKKESDEPIELRTPPLHPKQSFKLLDKIFNLIKECGYTNYSTGFHVNISPTSKKIYGKINPFYLVSHPLFEKITRDFKRHRNGYCKTYTKKDFLPKKKKYINNIDYWQQRVGENACYGGQDILNPNYYGHSSAVNFDNYDIKQRKDCRLEIRAFGNKDYHHKIDKIAKYTDKILDLYIKSTKIKFKMY